MSATAPGARGRAARRGRRACWPRSSGRPTPGCWAFGYVAYEAAAGLDPQLARAPVRPDGHAAGVVRPLRRADPGAAPRRRPRRGRHAPARRRGARRGRAAEHARDVARVRDRIAAGDTYQCNLTVRMAGRVHGDPFGLYRDLALGQRGAHNAYLDLGRFAVASASPELFFERRGDEVLLRPMKGTARRGRHPREDEVLARRLRAQRQGAGRERHDRRSAAERRRPRRRDRQRRRAGAVHGRALRDGAPAHLRRHRPAAAGDRAGRAVPGALPLRLGHRGAQGELHGRHPLAGADAPRRLLRRDRSRRAARRAGPGPLQRRDPDRRRGHGDRRRRLRHRRRHHVGLRARGRARRGRSPRRPSSRRTSRSSSCWRPCGTNPRRGLRNRDRHLRRMAESAEHLGFRFDPSDVVEALRARPTGGDAARVRLRLRRTGAVAVDVEPLPAAAAGPRRPRARRRAGRPGRAVALPQDDVPGALRASAAAAARRRRRHHGQHAPGAHRGHARHPRRWTSTGPGARPRWRPGVCRASSGPACSTAVSCTSGCSGLQTWRRPGGWR